MANAVRNVQAKYLPAKLRAGLLTAAVRRAAGREKKATFLKTAAVGGSDMPVIPVRVR